MSNGVNIIFKSKADTLSLIKNKIRKSKVPKFLILKFIDWKENQKDCLQEIQYNFSDCNLIVRSSTKEEDSNLNSFAGFFDSVSCVSLDDENLIINSINKVFHSYQKIKLRPNSQIIIQEMIENVSMSGVVFTRDINTGSPYYIINYDDETGRTDTITAGMNYNNRSLYILRGEEKSLRSKRFINLMKSVKELEKFFNTDAIDLEFALDNKNKVFIFQIRQLTTSKKWDKNLNKKIKYETKSIESFLENKFGSLKNIYGTKSIFGQMPDWNPVEMIGRSPKKLALSLYKYLITDQVWREARSEMGYNVPIGMPLMISLAGVPYIDCRLSFNSFLPADLDSRICDKIVNAWLSRLEENQHLHDKIEFEVVTAEFSFNFDEKIQSTIPNILSKNELNEFKTSLWKLTKDIVMDKKGKIDEQLKKIDILQKKNERLFLKDNFDLNVFVGLLEDCKTFGTLPFSILARHAFISQSLLKSLVSKKIISLEEYDLFFNNIKTVASDIIEDADKFVNGYLKYSDFTKKYGHLRPGTYDILSKRYDEISTLFSTNKKNFEKKIYKKIKFSNQTMNRIQSELNRVKFDMTADDLINYFERSIKSREYAKFVFSKNISDALKCIQKFGEKFKILVDDLSHIPLSVFFNVITENNDVSLKKFLLSKSKINKEKHMLTSSIHLPYLICNKRDVSVIPLLINRPNFITREILSAKIVVLKDNDFKIPKIDNKIAVLERADPGYDWIFSKNIKGLITKYGGSNSHMAIRCAEFNIPAAIGCGDQIYERVIKSKQVEINCLEGKVQPIL